MTASKYKVEIWYSWEVPGNFPVNILCTGQWTNDIFTMQFDNLFLCEILSFSVFNGIYDSISFSR